MSTMVGIQDKLDIAVLHLMEFAHGAAYDTLTSILNLEPNNATALKLRAEAAIGIYDKRRQTALDDIEAALRVNANSGELYLLQNKILLSRNDYAEANKRLKKAPFCVFHDDPHLAEIRDLYEFQSVRELNYLVTMPTEVIYNVMTLLPFRYRVRCLAVSTRWRNTFRCIPDLWRDPDYMECRNLRSASIAQSLATLMKWTDLRKLSVSLTTPVIEALVRGKCHSLTEVRFLQNDHVSQLVQQLFLRAIGSTWQKVEVDHSFDAASFLHAAAVYCPRLTELIFRQPRWTQSLSTTILSLMQPLKVTKLTLVQCDMFSPALANIVLLCPEVVDLTINDSQQTIFGSVSFANIFRHTKNLKRLTLQSRYGVFTRQNFLRTLPLESLEVLDIQGLHIDCESLLQFADEMQTGILKCCGDSFTMDDRPERNRLKNVIKEKLRDAVPPPPRPTHVEGVNSEEDEDFEDEDEEFDDEYSDEEESYELYIDRMMAQEGYAFLDHWRY